MLVRQPRLWFRSLAGADLARYLGLPSRHTSDEDEDTMTAYETIIVERPEPRIAQIVMNRPEARNAQKLQMTYDLNAAFDRAVQDDEIKVIILAGAVRTFGRPRPAPRRQKLRRGFSAVGTGAASEPKRRGRFAREQEIYLQITRRWRNLGSRPSRRCRATASPAA